MSDTAAPSSTPTTSSPPADTSSASVDTKSNSTAAPASTVAADAQAVIADPNASAAEKKVAQKMLKQLTYKYNGKEFTETLPFEIPDTPEAIEYQRKQIQMAKMAHLNAQQKSDLEKDLIKFMKDLKENPELALTDPAVGLNLDDFVKNYIEKQIENSKKSPEQLELEKTRKELKDLKDRQDLEAKNREEQERQALTDKLTEEYDQQITAALESKKIPRSPAAVKKIIDYMQLAINYNKDVTINDVLPFVHDELISDYKEHAGSLPDDALEEFFGKDLIDRIRKITVAKAKKAASNPAVQNPTSVPSTGKGAEVKKPVEKVSYKKFFSGF